MSRNSYSSRPSFGGRDKPRGGSRGNFHQSRSGGGFNSGGQNHFRNKIKYMDPRLIIKKEAEFVKSDPYIATHTFADFNFFCNIKVSKCVSGNIRIRFNKLGFFFNN